MGDDKPTRRKLAGGERYDQETRQETDGAARYTSGSYDRSSCILARK